MQKAFPKTRSLKKKKGSHALPLRKRTGLNRLVSRTLVRVLSRTRALAGQPACGPQGRCQAVQLRRRLRACSLPRSPESDSKNAERSSWAHFRSPVSRGATGSRSAPKAEPFPCSESPTASSGQGQVKREFASQDLPEATGFFQTETNCGKGFEICPWGPAGRKGRGGEGPGAEELRGSEGSRPPARAPRLLSPLRCELPSLRN